MTHFDRALTKAFTRRESAQPTTESTNPDTTRGWVSRVRAPACKPNEVEDALSPVEALPEAASTFPVPPGTDETSPRQAADAEDLQNFEPAIAFTANQASLDESARSWCWPTITTRLLESSAAADLRRLAIYLESLSQQRTPQSIAFCGPGRMTGRTSLLMTVARILIQEAELRVLLLDADADQAGLSAELGAASSSAGGEASSLDIGRIQSPDVVRWAGERGTTEVYAAAANRELPADWRHNFDLLLVDAGSWKAFHGSGLVQAGVIDAVISVRRYDASDDDESAQRLCRDLGVRLLGVVETFVPAKAGEESQAA